MMISDTKTPEVGAETVRTRPALRSCFALYLAAAGLLLPSPAASAPLTLTLQESYDKALTTSEQIARRGEDIRFAEATYREAVGALYPNIHLNGSERIRDSASFGTARSGSDESGDDDSATGGGQRFTSRSKEQFESSISVRQPIFSGFREILLAQAFRSDTTATKLEKRRAEEQLYGSVAEVYYQVALYGQDILILDKVEEILKKRTSELRQFIDLGKSRESEVLSAQSEIADVRATRERTKGLLGASKELLAFLIGTPAAEFGVKLPDNPAGAPPIDTFLSRSAERVDIQAAEERVEGAAKRLTAAEREHWPSFSFEGNAYPHDDPDLNREWEMLFRMDLPIFEGGAIEARVAQRDALLRSSRLTSQETRRIAEREVRIAYNDYQSSLLEMKSLKALYDAALKNHESQRKDYELGVVTNLDVLAAIRQAQDARRRLLAAEIGAHVNRARLEVAAGGIS